MQEIDLAATITRESEVTTENVQQILDFAFGKGDMTKPTAPLEKANVEVTNPEGHKVEGTVTTKPK
ncbi:MAG: hypothetical protein KA175_01295 [Flavobacteriales bacterium]|nr:hypothetical protein [Flavobacteriales bacterium]